MKVGRGTLARFLLFLGTAFMIYPAEMALVIWYEGMIAGRRAITVVSCGGPATNAVNCVGEGWIEFAFMAIGFVLGLAAYVVAAYLLFVPIGRSERRKTAGVREKVDLTRWAGRALMTIPVMSVVYGSFFLAGIPRDFNGGLSSVAEGMTVFGLLVSSTVLAVAFAWHGWRKA